MFRVRLATEEDSASIIDFQQKMANETEGLELKHDVLTDGVRSVFRDPHKGKYFVGEFEDQIVASMLTTYEWSDWRNQWILWLQSVYVKPKFRGQGVFRLMYESVKKQAESDSSISGIRLYVDATNKNALKVYESVGMDGEHYKTFEWMK